MSPSTKRLRITRPSSLPKAARPAPTKPESRRRFVVIEDQTAIRELMCETIAASERCEVVGSSSDGQEGLALALTLRPDVLVVDILMPGLSGIDVLRRLSGGRDGMRILVFSARQDPHIVRSLVQIGIHGFVNKAATLSEFRQAVDALAKGGTWFTEDFDRTVREALASPSHSPDGLLDLLTPREREIAVLITRSHSSKEVASRLNISIKTAENHRANLMRKLGVRDVAGLVRYIIRQGLVDPSAG
ncbi:MAG: response regulator [Opitutales bacterium]